MRAEVGVAHPLGHLSEADVPPRQACSTVPWRRVSSDGDCCLDSLPTEYRACACLDQRSQLAGDLRSKEPIITKSLGVSAVQRSRPSSVVFLICALPVPALACFSQLTLTGFDADAQLRPKEIRGISSSKRLAVALASLAVPAKGSPARKGGRSCFQQLG